MKLSIVIPAYNEEAYIGACLTSVFRAKEGQLYPIEVIVVNNASTDATRSVALSFSGTRVVDEPRKGLVRARQTGYEASSGDLVANIDADTRMPKDWITRVMEEFEAYPKVVALSGPYVYYDVPWLTNIAVQLFYGFGKMMSGLNTLVTGRKGTMLQGGNFVLRRSALRQAGGFDLNFDFYGEDTAIAKQMGRQGQVKFTFRLPMFTSGRRLMSEGVLTMAWKYAMNFLWALVLGRPYSTEYKDIRL